MISQHTSACREAAPHTSTRHSITAHRKQKHQGLALSGYLWNKSSIPCCTSPAHAWPLPCPGPCFLLHLHITVGWRGTGHHPSPASTDITRVTLLEEHLQGQPLPFFNSSGTQASAAWVKKKGRSRLGKPLWSFQAPDETAWLYAVTCSSQEHFWTLPRIKEGIVPLLMVDS